MKKLRKKRSEEEETKHKGRRKRAGVRKMMRA
jgi:hypothetical protein